MLATQHRDWLNAAERPLRRGWALLAEPKALARLQRLVLLLLLLWTVSSLARLFWAALPSADITVPKREVMNPVLPSGAARDAVSVDLTAMLGLGLFGDPAAEVETLNVASADADNPREGIEDGARETRLALVLSGIVASTGDGLGSAVIESKNVQDTYAVGDVLPVSGSVTLAKVLPTQVVLDNNGVYELLKLFEGEPLLAASVSESAVEAEASPARGEDPPAPTRTRVDDAEAVRLASDYRQQLYDNPQSLAEVVTVAAVRDGGKLRGYRIAPGRNPRAFRALGFESGDIVTAVNGMSLDDPANTVRLYQTMRDATEATFDIERKGGAATISVSLGSLNQE